MKKKNLMNFVAKMKKKFHFTQKTTFIASLAVVWIVLSAFLIASVGKNLSASVLKIQENPTLQKSNFKCSLQLSEDTIVANDIVELNRKVQWNFFATAIKAYPILSWWNRNINANQYNGTTYVGSSQPGDYTFSLTVRNNLQNYICRTTLHVIADCTTPENVLACDLWLPSCPPECR